MQNSTKLTETIEDIVLRHGSRGMNVLKKSLPADYSHKAAEMILSWQKGRTILLTTGFYVAGYAETDGPAGTVFLALALKKLGFNPVIVTDSFCKDFFELKGLEVAYMPFDGTEKYCAALLEKYQPVGLISVERCGININGRYENMRRESIGEFTARTDILFTLAYGKIPTIGVGDGGNEIGMGNVAELISSKLSLVPCSVKVDCLVIASVSNWGAYSIVAYLDALSQKTGLLPDFKEIEDYICITVKIGSVDGVKREKIVGVDGFGMDTEKEIVLALKNAVINYKNGENDYVES